MPEAERLLARFGVGTEEARLRAGVLLLADSAPPSSFLSGSSSSSFPGSLTDRWCTI